ncbi:hypothetical protein [Nocardioides sp. cx-173]|uniref:hypothetical protein n=1 Tax=Nocardioides sp. cx-173 TaxID=2898796 RepID=UPI001E39451F|nr:hypothetical protein [Nocardioides sp. cx-173]MCD4523510.1 hypothetical protein [Nocardioides sp. cx-173]UGB42152.1 hypothetical protein LQ940_01160 [Nocardioides sp. cx-173]
MPRSRLTRPVLAMLLAVGTALAAPAAPARAGTASIAAAEHTFLLAYPTLAREDFEGSKVASGVKDCGTDVLSSATTDECYAAGTLTPGVRYRVVDGDGANFTMALGAAGYQSLSSTAVLANATDDELVLDFTSPVDTVGFRLGTLAGGTCVVTVSYVDLSAATQLTVDCPALSAMRFVGITADRLIDHVQIMANGSAANEAVDDVRFGLRAPPNTLRLGAARGNRAAGTAVLPATVPGVGTTTLAGRGVAPVSLDSARARTLSLPVVARGAARRTLLRKGRVTVRVTVTYRPNGGAARSVTTSVTLRKRR